MRTFLFAFAVSVLSITAAYAEPARKLGSSVQGLMFYASDLRMATLEVGNATYLVRRTTKAELRHAHLEIVSLLARNCQQEILPIVERHNNFTPPALYWPTVTTQVKARLPECVRAKIAKTPILHMGDVSFTSID